MNRNLSTLLLVAALGSLAGCMTSPISSSGSGASSSASGSASGQGSTSSAAPGARTPLDVPDSLGTGQSPADTAGLKELERGQASWYGPRFHGRRTASGERYDMHALTAAHRTLPFGTMVRVRSMVNGHEVDVRITDRGPFSHNRVIDVSRAAAEALGMLGLGVKPVVLLVPESTSAVAEPSPPAKKSRRARRSPGPRAG